MPKDHHWNCTRSNSTVVELRPRSFQGSGELRNSIPLESLMILAGSLVRNRGFQFVAESWKGQ
jgi:hypothetical protein